MFRLLISVTVVVACLAVLVFAAMMKPSKSDRCVSSTHGPFDLFYDKNGVFVVEVTVDGQNIWAVVDTGSSHLLVGGDSCLDCVDEDNRHTFVRPMSEPLQKGQLVQYGTQQDVVDWHKGVVSIGPREEGARVGVEFAVAQHRFGSSNYNILGVGRMRERDRPGFVRHYCGADVVSVELTGATGRLWIGGKHHPSSMAELPMLPAPFFRVEVAGVECGSLEASPEDIPVGGLIFDTGSNMLDLPPSMYDRLYPGIAEGQPLVLWLGPKQASAAGGCRTGTLRIEYGPKQSRWPNGDLLIERGADSEFIVLGSLFMNHMRFVFDTRRQVCGVSLLR